MAEMELKSRSTWFHNVNSYAQYLTSCASATPTIFTFFFFWEFHKMQKDPGEQTEIKEFHAKLIEISYKLSPLP